MRDRLFLFTALILVVASASCSNQPAPPKPGTPAFYWAAARTTYHNGDFVKANESLVQIASSDNEFTARARPWSIMTAAGIARGYAELAATYDAGAKANRANPTPFIKQASALRSAASAAAMEFAETSHQFLQQNKDPNVRFAFEFPTGSATEPAGLKRISSGILIQDSERDMLLKAMLQRGVLLTVCEALGSPEDPAKGAEQLKTGEAQVPRATFLYAVAQALHTQSDLFSASKLDKPDRVRMLCEQAREALQAIPETKESKALDTKVQGTLKKLSKKS